MYKPTVITSLLATTIIWAAAAQTARDPNVVDPTGTDLERGRAVAVGSYAVERPSDPAKPHLEPSQAACFKCHGIDGKGDGAAVFPRLADQVYKYLYDSLKDYASGVRQSPIMAPIARALTDQQMRDVSAYYAAQKNVPYAAPQRGDVELLQHGAALAAVGSAERGVQGCVNCHGPDGVGLPPIYPYLAGQYAPYLGSQLRAWKSGQRKGDGFAIMERIASQLTERDIEAVALYYARVRPAAMTPERDQAGGGIEALPRFDPVAGKDSR